MLREFGDQYEITCCDHIIIINWSLHASPNLFSFSCWAIQSINPDCIRRCVCRHVCGDSRSSVSSFRLTSHPSTPGHPPPLPPLWSSPTRPTRFGERTTPSPSPSSRSSRTRLASTDFKPASPSPTSINHPASRPSSCVPLIVYPSTRNGVAVADAVGDSSISHT